MGKAGSLQTESPDPFEQGISQTGQEHPELVGPPFGAARAVGEESELLLLDPVLHFSPRTIHILVESLGPTHHAGDDETWIPDLELY